MECNTCEICGANNGRAGMLIGNSSIGKPHACMNCHDTRESGNLVIHSNLRRTDEEIQKTMDILNKKPIKLPIAGVYGTIGDNWVNQKLNYQDATQYCLHDGCPECKGTGTKLNGASCFHYISCSCPKCTPRY